MDQKDYERLAKVEAQLENLTQLVVELKAQLGVFSQHFPTRIEVAEMFRSRDEAIKEMKEDKRSNKALIASWASVVVAVVAVGVALLK
ncbi:hypothetical protein [Bacillus wiedmannii]|uniref:hypothetical protein n=1 Tax=Bacillus wiedmannii TaxID=1890302 RepID=UPI000D0869E6|nr:hypothetical protein [Bacillus wiedmannii]PRT19816.1 hypothetical protein C6360_20570 [Bacillus wiedmannii]